MRRISVSEALEPALRRIRPRDPVLVPLAEAAGSALAADVIAPQALPPGPIALRAGFAVASLELVGASPHSPVMVMPMPTRVWPGMALPDGCDAVLPPDRLRADGAVIEITETVAPGEGVRRAGHDLATGALLARRGTRLSPGVIWVLQLAGVESVVVARPRVALEGFSAANGAWLAAVMSGLGCGVVAAGEPADLAFLPAEQDEPVLALAPGETASLEVGADGRVLIRLPDRFDGMLAALVALALPVIEHVTGRQLDRTAQPIIRKIASSVGVSEIVLLTSVAGGYRPLQTGEITLEALAIADAATLIGPESEGATEGTIVSAIPLSLFGFSRA